MKYNKLGKTNIAISEIGFGCMALKNDAAVNEQLLHAALDKGINYFDTADIYQHGANESLLGKVFKEKRQQVVIATKVGNVYRPDGQGLDWNPAKAHILSSVEESLQRLQTDYIDLYQLHGGTIQDNMDETIEAFELLQSQGKIRAYGISSIRPNVIREYVKRSNMVSVMMQYSLLDRRPEESCLQLLLDNKISVLSRGSVAQGLLTGKPATAYLDYNEADVKNASEAVLKISNATRNPSRTAIDYVLQHEAVSSAVVGMRTMEQLEAALNSGSETRLTQDEMQLLQQSIPVNYYTSHR